MKGLTLHFTVIGSKNANLDLIPPFVLLLGLLEQQNTIWLRRANTKTARCIIHCKVTVDNMRAYIIEDNFAAAYVILNNHHNFIEDLKQCFYRKKEMATKAFLLYQKCVKAMITFHDRNEANIKLK